MRVHSFPPIADAASETLILGSMPGKASLRAGHYYAHARNLFWRILGVLLEMDAEASYETRIATLRSARIALWDVLESCTRESSLDSDIDESSIVVNGFGEFLRVHERIRIVCFNGAGAERLFRKHALPGLAGIRPLTYHRLPSTSPANAALPFAAKLEAWRVVLSR